MSQALYRTYRSRSLGEVVGQEHITATLERAIGAGHVAHAYLFTGPRGTGKTSVARILAHQINNLPYSDETNLDIIEIDAASNRRIDDIRDLREKVHITPVKAVYKVYIIDEVHMLTSESFNALLKTLEEPPAHVVFILATTEAHKLPATIISRTQRFVFRPAAPQKLIEHMRSIAKKEGIQITDEALAVIAEHADGSFRDSLSLLDQLTHTTTGLIDASDVENSLGLAPRIQLADLVTAISARDRQAVSAALGKIEASGVPTVAILQQLNRALAQAATDAPQLYVVIDQLLEVPHSYDPRLKLLSVLMRATSPSSLPPPEPPKRVAQLAVAAAPIVSMAPVKASKAKPSEAPKLTELTSEQWAAVLAEAKKTNPPLFSVVKQASPRYDASTNTLKLMFKYQLHSKKLAGDAKQKAALANIMRATIDAAPAIEADIDPLATPGLMPDPAIASVAAIMGGGEAVDAKI